MAVMEIKKFGCRTLREVCAPVQDLNSDIVTLIDNMFETMHAAEGIGLAACQVGVLQRVIVLDVGHHDPEFGSRALVNPEILWSAGEMVGEEGCLSIPGVAGDVRRAAQVRMRALDRSGETLEFEATGMAARAAQHEMDHLDGVLVTERFSTIRRNIIRSQLRKIRREGVRQDTGPVLLDSSGVDTAS